MTYKVCVIFVDEKFANIDLSSHKDEYDAAKAVRRLHELMNSSELFVKLGDNLLVNKTRVHGFTILEKSAAAPTSGGTGQIKNLTTFYED